VKNNKVIWTGSLTAPADNLIVLRNQMAREVRQELVPVSASHARQSKTAALPRTRSL